MALDGIIPRRPQSIESKLSAADKNCIEYLVAFGVKNEEAYLLFHPEYMTADGKLNQSGKRACRDFFGYSKNKDYREAYMAFLKEYVGGGSTATPQSEELSDERIDKAYQSFLKQAIEDIENGKEMDNDTKKLFMELFKKLGRFKDDVESEIRPLRFLPERCFQGCRYRLFVENAVKGGDLVDECRYCRALRYANENGYKDNPTDRLDIPKEVLDAEPENTVSTLDIINGKIEN